MTIYVDDVELPYGRMTMCHCWTDGPLDDLLTMMDRVGVARKWIQKPPAASWVHFDISAGARRRALTLGAVLTDRYGPMEHVARLNLSDPDPAVRDKARHDLSRIRMKRGGSIFKKWFDRV